MNYKSSNKDMENGFYLNLAAVFCFEVPQIIVRRFFESGEENTIMRCAPYVSLESMCEYFRRK